MQAYSAELSVPKNEGDFERMCVQVYGVAFGDPLPKINGRSGQAQGGVDIYVEHPSIGRVGVQCKKYFRTKLKWKDVVDEVAAADAKKVPIKLLLIATTSLSDAGMQQKALELSDLRKKSGLFGVSIEFWEDIGHRIESHASLQEHYAPNTPGAAFHKQERELGAIKEIAVRTHDMVEAFGSLPAGRVDSLNRFVTAQLDANNELIRAGRFRDALDATEAMGKDLGPFDDHQKARWLLQRGLCLWFSRDDVAQAAALFAKAHETFPDDERMAAARIRGLMLSGDAAAAAKVGTEDMERFPLSLQVWLARSNAMLLAGGKIDEEDIPAAFVNEPDAVMFAAMSTRERGDLDGAVVLAERSALLPSAGFFNHSAFLRLAVEDCAREPVLAQFGIISAKRRERLAKAAGLLEPRSERLWTTQSSAAAETAIHLGFAHLLLGNPETALAIAIEAKAVRASAPELVRIELQALDDSGRHTEALSAAKASLKTLPPEALAAASEIAARNGDPAFIAAASTEIAARFPEQASLADYLAGLRWGALAKHGDRKAVVAEILATDLPASDRLVLLCAGARILRWAGSVLEASEHEDRALALVSPQTSGPDRLLVAELMFNAERWNDAAELYGALLGDAPPAVSDLHARLLASLVEADRRPKAKALLDSLPEGWAEHDEIRRCAINLGQRAGDWNFLAPLADRQAAKAPGEVVTWLFRLNVMLRTAPPAKFQAEMQAVPEETTGTIRNIGLLAGLEIHYGVSEKGLRRLYRLLRRNLDDAEAYSAYLSIFLLGRLPAMNVPATAGAGCSVVLESEDGRTETVVVDPEDCGSLPKRDEFLPPGDPWAVVLAGTAVGDTVELPLLAGGVRKMSVREIGSAYVRLAEIAQSKARSLGGIPHMKSVDVGTSGDPETDLAAMYAEMTRFDDQRARLFEIYGEGTLTLSMFAKALGRTPVETVCGWPDEAPPLFVGDGQPRERDEALKALLCPDALYATDSMTLAELIRFGATTALCLLPKIIVPVATKERTDALLHEAENDTSFGTAFDAGGRVGFVEFDDSHREKRIAFAKSLTNAVVDRCEVGPSYGELGAAPEAAALGRLLAGEERELLLLAKERGATILTVDGRLRHIAKTLFGISSVWPQALVMGALTKGIISNQDASRFAIGEFFANRSFVSLRSDDLLWMVAQGDSWVQRGIPLLKRYVASPVAERDSTFQVVFGFLEGIARMHTQLGAFGELLFHVAEAMFRRADSPVDLRETLLMFVTEMLINAAPPEHILSAVNVHRNRELSLRRSHLEGRINEALRRSHEPAGAEPVRIRVLHCATVPWLVVDRTARHADDAGKMV